MGLLDISGFFTGLIINLLLITLVCYYFKRKYENIEEAQMEQAKVLYELLQKSSCEKYCEKSCDISKSVMCTMEDDSSFEDESEYSEESETEDFNELIVENIKEVQIETDVEYNKMSVKSLRDLLTTKGIKTNNKMKKNELISLVTNKKSLIVDLAMDEPLEESLEEPLEETVVSVLEETEE